MAADLHIHVFTEGELTEDDFRSFFSRSIGSKWFDGSYHENWFDISNKFHDTANIWIGEVSWLKAALFEDAETFVPDPVAAIADIVGEDWPVVDEEFINKIKNTIDLDNKTDYSINQCEKIVKFLDENKGKMAFSISW